MHVADPSFKVLSGHTHGPKATSLTLFPSQSKQLLEVVSQARH